MREPAASSCARRSAIATSSRRCCKTGYILGGEQSGHIVFLDHATTGDGIVAALRVLAIMAREGKPLSELARVMTRMPQVLVNTRSTRRCRSISSPGSCA